MQLHFIPTQHDFETIAEGISNELKYGNVSEEQANSILTRQLHSYKLDDRYLKNGFAIRPNLNGDRYGFTVVLSIKDDNGPAKVLQFDFPEKSWREL